MSMCCPSQANTVDAGIKRCGHTWPSLAGFHHRAMRWAAERLKFRLSNLSIDELEIEDSIVADNFVGPAEPAMNQRGEIAKQILEPGCPVIPSVDGDRIFTAILAWIKNKMQCLAEHQFGTFHPNCTQSHNAIVR